MHRSGPIQRLNKKTSNALIALLAATTLHHAQAASATECTNLAAPESGTSAFTWATEPEAQPAALSAAYNIAIWGDSLTSARNFIDAALKTSRIDKTTPSFVQAGIKVPGLSLPLKHSCASAGWKTAYAYKEKGNTPAFSEGMLSMESSMPGDVIHMDFRYPDADARVTQLDIQYEKAAPDGSLLLGVVVLTAGFFIAHAVASAWVGRLAQGAKGHASSLYLLTYCIGSSTMGSVGGWFWEYGHWPGVAALGGALMLLALGVAISLRPLDR